MMNKDLNLKYIFKAIASFGPFIHHFLKYMEQFLMMAKKRQEVLMAFKNSGSNYQNILKCYRTILELPLYVSS